MELKKVNVKGFKKVRDVALDLADLNILVGSNASGKSSILQAIHLASCLMRQTKGIRADSTSTLSINELDYLPTNDYKKLGHDGDWGNTQDTPSSSVIFQFQNPENGEDISARSEFRQARNAGISVKGSLPPSIQNLYRGENKFFSAYIPGISGIPNEEAKQSRRVVLKSCSFGDANVYLRNALNLLEDGDIEKIESWLEALIGLININIEHDEDKDLTITATARINYRTVPLELLGMGYLQLIQIFCYLLLFKPSIMLIDEPDIHLHPNVQEKLPKILSKIAREQGLKIILSSHSPFIVRGAPMSANVCWLQDGAVNVSNRQEVELALGWGAFGKKIIIFSEDTNTVLLKHIISQWPEIENSVAIHPGNGHKNLLKPHHAKELRETLGNKFNIVIHRDRDAFTNAEIDMLKERYSNVNVYLWVPDYADIESYFCEKYFLMNFLGETEDDVERILDPIIEEFNRPNNSKFIGQRRDFNDELYGGDGNSPSSHDVWTELQSRPLKAACGKLIFNKLKSNIQGNKFSEMNIQLHNLDGNLAISLKHFLERLL